MDSACTLPPRRNLTLSKISKHHLSPLQILLQMGFQRQRAEKALAATGHRGAQLAADWLLAHVNDPTLDSCFAREYILYACPYGELLQQLELFWRQSFEKCGWNGALNFMPHVTLVSFFKAPDECSQQLAQTLEQVVNQELLDSKNLVNSFVMEPYISPNFIGLFVSEENSSVLKHIALQYVKEVSNAIINDNYEQLDAIATCFPWCTNTTSRFSILPKHIQSISLEPHVKSLHLTLANQFLPEHFETLKQLTNNIINTNLHTFWEIRLYSRDARAAGKRVYKVVYSYIPKESDELELRIGDFVYVSEHTSVETSDGWVEGTSWLTGCTGFFPVNYTVRTAETDSWTLHKSVPLFESDTELKMMRTVDADGSCESEMPAENFGNSHVSSLSSGITNNTFDTSINNRTSTPERNIYVMRHGERVDVTFGNWIPVCIGKDGQYLRSDLNMPVKLPERHGYPKSFESDTPLTNIGIAEAKLTGEGLALAGVNIQYAVCSPALRCVQTCDAVLTGLGVKNQIPIKIEPGLFEWIKWYFNDFPDWMTEAELIATGFKIDQCYKPYICKDKLKERMHETCSQYYERHFEVVQNILKKTTEQGGSILIVAHASSLDTCSRQLIGLEPRNEESLNKLMLNIPYCSLIKLHLQNTQWKIVESPIPCICHAMNQRFDYKMLIDTDE